MLSSFWSLALLVADYQNDLGGGIDPVGDSCARGLMTRTTVTDSPWFWVYVFGLSALGLAWWAAPTWVSRQARLERRVLVSDNQSFEASTEIQQQAEIRSIARLRQILVMLGIVVVVGWVGWIWKRRQETRSANFSGDSPLSVPPET